MDGSHRNRKRGRPARPRPERPLGLWALTRPRPGGRPRRVSLSALAAEAGVQRQWLGQVASGEKGTPPGLRRRVLAAAARLDLAPRWPLFEPLPEGVYERLAAERPSRATSRAGLRPPFETFDAEDWNAWKERRRTMLPDECLSHLGLERDPFEDPRLDEEFWAHPQWRLVVSLVEKAVRRHGFLLVQGPSGCGKTTLVRYALGNVAGDARRGRARNRKVHLARLLTLRRRRVGACALPRALLRDLSPGDRPKSNAEDLVHQVAAKIAKKFQEGETCCLLLEEAHELAPATWLDLKKLREICADAGGGLGVVCVGQTEGSPSLGDTLDDPDLVSVRRRLHVCEVRPLKAGEARKYVAFRLSGAGAKVGLVSPEAVDLLLKTLSPGGRSSRTAPLYPALLDTWLSAALVAAWEKGETGVGKALMSFVLTGGGGETGGGD